jgi:galactose mutarotase-like enzyme
MDQHTIRGTGVTAIVKADGAELCSLRNAAGRELLWQALPAWPRHAPVLFPIVGRLKDDRLRHRGREYRLTQHGFARDRRFAWADTTGASCRLVLEDDEATRAIFPFAFRFAVEYVAAGDTVSVIYTVTNTGDEILPASMGAHPAFNWPLSPELAKEIHYLEFDAEEPGPIRGVEGGLLLEKTRPTPIRGRVLPLREDLFAADALILDPVTSRSVRFSAPGGPGIKVAWDGFVELGVWMRPGVDLLCIEPWYGMASPVGFDGEFLDKPGIFRLAPGESRAAVHRIGVA